MTRLSRRRFLACASAIALAGAGSMIGGGTAAAQMRRAGPIRATSAPLSAVRLSEGPFRNAVERNCEYLLALDPDRLLHNFRQSAGLEPKGEMYGGWEARGIAGHTFGHYLSALALAFAQTGRADLRERLRHAIAEAAQIQAAHGDGYLAGTTVEREGEVLDGKIVFEELRRGDVRSGGFDVNGGWVPLYSWHKVHAGLLDAWKLADIGAARPVMLGVADYLGTILEGLDHEQMQTLLRAEYGGLNEAYAETFALTGDRRWLALAQRIRDDRVLDPLTAQQNILPGLHANTQIPKLIGLARLYELTGENRHRGAAEFFHRTVTRDHTYIIGGNSEREHFGQPGVISPFITDRTCEACNSYNMLKLTRHLFSWEPDGALFDFYERVHLNHIMAHQHPGTGMFAYFMPLGAGGRRTWSTPDDSFWCCVGSGLESHAKHGDSIYWHDGETLFVNLFIPSQLDWPDALWSLQQEPASEFEDAIALTVRRAPAQLSSLALRIPGWTTDARILVNGDEMAFETSRGYARLQREWRAGDEVTLVLPRRLEAHPTPDNDRVIAFTHGPTVLAADLGPASQDLDMPAPAIISADPLAEITSDDPAGQRFTLQTANGPVLLAPFFARYESRTAVYFPLFSQERWVEEEAAFLLQQRSQAELAARTIDVLQLGEQQPETDHNVRFNHADLLAWEGRSGRQVWWGVGNWLEFDMAVAEGPLALRVLYWGEETAKNFMISVDGELLTHERRDGPPVPQFVEVDYPIPQELTAGRENIRVRFETNGSDAPVYEVRIVTAAPPRD